MNRERIENKRCSENGVVVVNAILLIAILFCVGIIVTLVNGEKEYEQETAKTNETIINSDNYETNIVKKNTTVVDLAGDNNTNKIDDLNANININNIDNANENNYTNSADSESQNSYKKYFYNQLDSNGKVLYSQISGNIDALKSGTSPIKFDISGEDIEHGFQACWDSLMLDNPQIFYIDTNNISLETKSSRKLFGEPTYSYQLIPGKRRAIFC